MTHEPILPGAWFGLLGGGQLGRMFAQAAATLGYRVCVLEKIRTPRPQPSGEMHLCAAYTDRSAPEKLGREVSLRHYRV